MNTGKVYRPEVRDAPNSYAPDRFDSYYMIRDSVQRRDVLIFGKLHDAHGDHCAIGAFFTDNPKLALRQAIIEEVAAYNDSIPAAASPRVRRRKVLAWLSAKLRYLNLGRPPAANVVPMRKHATK